MIMTQPAWSASETVLEPGAVLESMSRAAKAIAENDKTEDEGSYEIVGRRSNIIAAREQISQLLRSKPPHTHLPGTPAGVAEFGRNIKALLSEPE